MISFEGCAFYSRAPCHRSVSAASPRWQQQHNGMSERLLLRLRSDKRGQREVPAPGAVHRHLPPLRGRRLLRAGAAEGARGEGALDAEVRAFQPEVQPEQEGPEQLPQELRGGERGGHPCWHDQTSVGLHRRVLLRGNCGVDHRWGGETGALFSVSSISSISFIWKHKLKLSQLICALSACSSLISP